MKRLKTIGWVTVLILVICGFIVIPVIVFSLIFGSGISGALEPIKAVGLFTLWTFGLGALPMILWEKAKKSEYAGILCISVVFGEGYAIYKEMDGILNIISTAFVAFIGAFIVLIIVFMVVGTAIKEGEKEFYKDKEDYNRLKNKNIDELTLQEPKRLKYLEAHKKDFEGEFKPDRISVD